MALPHLFTPGACEARLRRVSRGAGNFEMGNVRDLREMRDVLELPHCFRGAGNAEMRDVLELPHCFCCIQRMSTSPPSGHHPLVTTLSFLSSGFPAAQ